MIIAAGGVNMLVDVKADYAVVGVERSGAAQPEAVLIGEKIPAAQAKAADTFAIAKNSPQPWTSALPLSARAA
ncbi:hypothetical protein [Nonomuraea sp. NPDC003754]